MTPLTYDVTANGQRLSLTIDPDKIPKRVRLRPAEELQAAIAWNIARHVEPQLQSRPQRKEVEHDERGRMSEVREFPADPPTREMADAIGVQLAADVVAKLRRFGLVR